MHTAHYRTSAHVLQLRLWNTQTGACFSSLYGHKSAVRSVAVTSDGTKAVSAGMDQRVRVWDLQTEQCLHTLRGHRGHIWTLACSSDGSKVVSGSYDKVSVWLAALRRTSPQPPTSVPGGQTIKLWDVSSGKLISSLEEQHPSEIRCLSLLPGAGLKVAVGYIGEAGSPLSTRGRGGHDSRRDPAHASQGIARTTRCASGTWSMAPWCRSWRGTERA
jgi:WD40 repeat protein